MLRSIIVIAVVLALVAGCREGKTGCPDCDTVVIAATGEPTTLVPPLIFETVGRDISDQIYERLAYLAPKASPIEAGAYRPGLARSWERLDSLTWRFHLRNGARWHDGRPVTAEDVVFSFQAYTDSTLEANALSYLAGKVRVSAEDSATVRVTFAAPSPEQLYDATYHVRILPKHVWDSIPRSRWSADTNLAHLVGSGPYHIESWLRGRSLTLAADTTRAGNDAPSLRRAVWRFVPDPDAALNLLLAHEADILETVGTEARARRVAQDTTFRLVTYPAAVYGFLAFRVADAGGRPHPVLGQRELRHALAQAVDRPTIARALFGKETKASPGPMSQLLWIWDDNTRVISYDSAQARGAITALKTRHPIKSIDILVPSTSSSRRQLAVAVQEAWRKAGINATVTTVEFPVMQERIAKGHFDTYIGAYLDEPSPRGLTDQWTRAGWEATNFGHYANPVFDSLLAGASREANMAAARRRWREAMDTLNADAPAIFLYSLANVAAVSQRLKGVEIDPYSWVSGLRTWRKVP